MFVKFYFVLQKTHKFNDLLLTVLQFLHCNILSFIALYFNPAHKDTGYLKVFRISFHTPYLLD